MGYLETGECCTDKFDKNGICQMLVDDMEISLSHRNGNVSGTEKRLVVVEQATVDEVENGAKEKEMKNHAEAK